jgi:uncharacterized protein (DUF2147 family)
MFAMRTVCIATALALLAGSAAHAGSIIDSFIGGSGLKVGDCGTDRCDLSFGKQKFAVRKSDFPSAFKDLGIGDKLSSVKSSAKERDKAAAVADQAASSRHEEHAASRADDRPAPPRSEEASPPTPVKTPAKEAVAPVDQKVAVAAPAPAPVVPAPAASDPKSPIGEWITEDGKGHVRIHPCGQALCGVISSADPKDTDRHNPDAGKRNRPLLGTPVLIDMKPANEKRWEGQIYNAQNGKTYGSNIALKNPDVLRVEGCVFGGFFCGGQDWTRAKDAPQG